MKLTTHESLVQVEQEAISKLVETMEKKILKDKTYNNNMTRNTYPKHIELLKTEPMPESSLSFTSWYSSMTYRPLGNVSRGRKVIYDTHQNFIMIKTRVQDSSLKISLINN